MLVISKVELRHILQEALEPKFNDLGFIIVSACQDGYVNSEQFKENKTQIEDLKASIQLSKYASVCVWAEYEKDGESTNLRITVKVNLHLSFSTQKVLSFRKAL